MTGLPLTVVYLFHLGSLPQPKIRGLQLAGEVTEGNQVVCHAGIHADSQEVRGNDLAQVHQKRVRRSNPCECDGLKEEKTSQRV